MSRLHVIRHSTGALSIDLEKEMERLPEQECVIEVEWHLLQTPLPNDLLYSPWQTEAVATPTLQKRHTQCSSPFKLTETVSPPVAMRTRSHSLRAASPPRRASRPRRRAAALPPEEPLQKFPEKPTFVEHWHRQLREKESRQRWRFLQQMSTMEVLTALQTL